MCFFSSSVNLKKAASLESFRQKAIQQATNHSDRQNWIRKIIENLKLNNKLEWHKRNKKKKKQHAKISIPKEFEEETTNSQVDLPAGGKRWRLNEGETEVKRQEKSRLWAPLVPSFPVLVRREAGQPARPLNFTLSNGRVGPVEEREVSDLVSLFLRGHTAGLDPEGRWLERQIYFSFSLFLMF